MKQKRNDQPSALQLIWYEIDPDEATGPAWGQFVGSIHRLLDIDDELAAALRHPDVRRRMHRATLIIESYLYRAYELRERTVGLLGAMSGDPAAARASKSPDKRAKALGKLRDAHPELVDTIDQILRLLDEDMLLRNMHTHEQFLSLMLVTPDGPYHPDDVLTDLEHRPDDFRAMSLLLRRETKKLVDEYRTRIRNIRDVAFSVATIADVTLLPKK